MADDGGLMLVIGVEGETACPSELTREQIEKAKKMYKLDLSMYDGQVINWIDIDNPDNPHSLFQTIIEDRIARVDNGALMNSRPPYAVLTVVNNAVVRLEYYAGENDLRKTYDLRSQNLHNIELENHIHHDSRTWREAQQTIVERMRAGKGCRLEDLDKEPTYEKER